MHLTLDWSKADRSDWDALFAAVPRSNLLQSWSYGTVKAQAESATVRRGVFCADDRPIGLVQAWEKRFGPATIVRVNRGPLWLRPLEQATLRQAFTMLRQSARWWRCRGLLIAPEICEPDMSFLHGLGFRRRARRAWRSAWIDLSDLDAVRRRLDRQWRNKLVAGERSGLNLESDTGDEAYAWMADRYQALMADRSFQGIPLTVLQGLRAQRRDADDIVVYRAGHNHTWCAGIVIARHGTAATYLVGWADEEGRRLRAVNVLIFRAMKELARGGCGWLDVGGIDDILTPGIARFKRGIRGEEYVLAGEFVSY
jgi:hypothetical protein